MARSKSTGDDWRLLAIRCGQLYANDPHSKQSDLAARLQLNAATVSRYLKYCFDHKILEENRPTFREENIPQELREDRQLKELQDRINLRVASWKRTDGPPCSVHVVPASDREAFCALAANVVHPLISRAQVIGVSLGGTIGQLIESLQASHLPPLREKRGTVSVIPVVGDLVHLMNASLLQYTASNLARKLADLFGSSGVLRLPTLTGVPAYISPELGKVSKGRHVHSQPEVEPHVLEWVNSIPGYREIFGNDEFSSVHVSKVDCLLTGLGVVFSDDPRDPKTGAALRERLAQEDRLKTRDLERISVGEIGGFILEREKIASEDKKLVKSLNQSWFGLQGEHLFRIAQRQAHDKIPGVIVLANGKEKAPAAKVAIEKGYLNLLCIDLHLADALASLS